MAYYAALVSLVQLLKEINNPDHPHLNSYFAKEQILLSLYEKFNHLQKLLDGYSRKNHKEEIADALESRIRDVACDAQDIIESHVSDLFSEKIKDMEKVKTKVGYIVEELMSIIENMAEGLKRIIEDMAEELMTIIEDRFTIRETYLQYESCYEELKKVKTNVGSIVEIVEELMTIKDKDTTREEYLQKKYYEELEKVKTNVGSIVEIVEELMTIKDKDTTLEEYVHVQKQYYEDLEKVKTNVGPIVEIVEELMTIKDKDTTREEYLQKKYYVELEKVKAEVDSILEEMVIKRESLTTQEEGLQRSSNISADSFGGTPKVEAHSGTSTMVGFDEQLLAIKNQLCGESSKLEVVSIVGMGGMGKTTLARNIFDDKLIDDHFDRRVWVTISQDYHQPKVLQGIANSLNIKEKEGLAEDIRKHLFGRRYLIVIDDIWDIEVWNDIRWIFPDNSNGSRIMITTRVLGADVHAGSSKFLHQMPFLNENQSWILLQQKVFAQERCPKELEVVGKLIAKKCRGLPLGIVAIAGVLSNVNKVQHDWEEIARHVSAVAIAQNDEHLSNILSLSYNHLPHHLKPCFLYLGGFPEDHDIRISRLIRLWVAEGFLRPLESKSLEKVGEEYLEDLVNRNLVFFTKKKFHGKFKFCGVHDLVRDLCSQRAHYENFLHCRQQDEVYHESIGNVHRYRIFASKNSLLLKYTREHFSTIRSIIFFSKYVDKYFSTAIAKCKLLRILDASKCSVGEIFELLHLRYFTLHVDFPIENISPSICMLWNLQTLIVKGIRLLLPCEIWKMPQLRHLILLGGAYAIEIPPIPYDEIEIIDGVPLLGKLQTLHGLHDFKFTRRTIEMIPNLKKLAVVYFGHLKSWEEVGLNNLVHLHQLEKLQIWFGSEAKPAKPLPKNFAFPAYLTKLTLIGCRLPWKKMRVVGSLPNLQVLKLRVDAFVGKEWEPIEEEFCKLKLLQLHHLSELKYWRAESNHFPCLEQLHIKHCPKLKGIPSEIGDIPTLQFIDVYYCNSAVGSSALKIQEEQRDQENDDLQVRVEPRLRYSEFESNSKEEDESNAVENESNSEEEDGSNAVENESNSEEEDGSNAVENESNSEEEDESKNLLNRRRVHVFKYPHVNYDYFKNFEDDDSNSEEEDESNTGENDSNSEEEDESNAEEDESNLEEEDESNAEEDESNSEEENESNAEEDESNSEEEDESNAEEDESNSEWCAITITS